MTIKVLDRAFETTTSIGTGDIVLQGAQTGFTSFALAGNAARVCYEINDGDASGVVNNWEVGIGTVNVGTPNTLTRNTVLSSSNSNNPVNFGNGTKNVLGAIAAKVLSIRDENLVFTEGFGVGGNTNANAHTVTFPVAPLNYTDGMDISYFANIANTGAMTINVNSLGAKTAKYKGTDLPPGASGAGTFVSGKYRSASGFIELISPAPTVVYATDSDFATGTDATKAVTSSNVLNNLGFSKLYESAPQVITSGGPLTLTHGLGRKPKLPFGFLVCQTAEAGFSVGDEIPVGIGQIDPTASRGFIMTADTTSIFVRFGSTGTTFITLNKTTGSSATLTNANWKLIIRDLG